MNCDCKYADEDYCLKFATPQNNVNFTKNGVEYVSCKQREVESKKRGEVK